MRLSPFDWLSLLLLLATAGVLAWPGSPSPSRVQVPLLLPADPPGSLHAPGADERAIQARALAIGEVITIEDLVRAALALEAEGAEGLPPLSEAERAELSRLLARAREHRDALMAVEGQLGAAEDRLDAAARELAGQLSPDQRAWIQGNRDAISVQGVEEGYWKQAEEGLK